MQIYSNHKVISIDPDISIFLERMHYILNSYESFISILAREFAENKSKETSDMLKYFSDKYQNAYIQYKLSIDTLIQNQIGYMPEEVKYKFDFKKNEVTLEW